MSFAQAPTLTAGPGRAETLATSASSSTLKTVARMVAVLID